MFQSLVRDSLITRFKSVDPDRRVLTRLECIEGISLHKCSFRPKIVSFDFIADFPYCRLVGRMRNVCSGYPLELPGGFSLF